MWAQMWAWTRTTTELGFDTTPGSFLSPPSPTEGMPDTDGLTRRQLLAGGATAGLATVAGCLGGPDDGPAPLPREPPGEAEDASLYPLATYEAVDGNPVRTMPMNVRIDLRESDADVEAVRDVFRYDWRWSPIMQVLDPLWPFHDSPGQYAWDSNGREFAPALASYRFPFPLRQFRGEIGHHIYLWPVRERGAIVGVAGQAHKDVGSVMSHVGADYDHATAAVADAFDDAGWRTEWGSFDYPFDREQLDYWGPTGDLVVRPPSG